MDAETPTPLPDPVPDPPADAITPLSVFFPEVTEEEARDLDGGTVAIMERRARVMALYRAGKTMNAIRQEVGCSLGTVHHDIHTVLAGYAKVASRTAQEHVANELQRLAHREAQVEVDLDRSRGVATETYSEQTSGGKGGGKARVRKRERYGDPRLHQLLQGWWDRRCRLLGLLRPEDFRKPDALPPVKLVAGLDPAEVV